MKGKTCYKKAIKGEYKSIHPKGARTLGLFHGIL